MNVWFGSMPEYAHSRGWASPKSLHSGIKKGHRTLRTDHWVKRVTRGTGHQKEKTATKLTNPPCGLSSNDGKIPCVLLVRGCARALQTICRRGGKRWYASISPMSNLLLLRHKARGQEDMDMAHGRSRRTTLQEISTSPQAQTHLLTFSSSKNHPCTAPSPGRSTHPPIHQKPSPHFLLRFLKRSMNPCQLR